MPTKKVSKSKENLSNFDFQNIVKNSDSYKSLIYGIVTVVVLFIVLFLGLRTLSKNQADITESAVNTVNNQRTHTVTEGETLWSIAEKEYGDGFKWEIIANANNIANANSLEKGARLSIPEVESSTTDLSEAAKKIISTTVSPKVEATKAITPTITPKTTEIVPVNQKIFGSNYKVVEGDNLWNIAVRAYGDGYRWVEIAKENKISNPNLIYPEDVFKLKRP